MPTKQLTSPSDLKLSQIQVREALELIVRHHCTELTLLHATVIGKPQLTSALGRYRCIVENKAKVIALGAEASEIHSVVGATKPHSLVTVVDGRLATILLPMRAGGYSLGRDLPSRVWHSLGYDLVQTRGVEGPASIFWATCERLARRFSRPDLADRCRIAMLQTLITSRISGSLATTVVREYRRRQ